MIRNLVFIAVLMLNFLPAIGQKQAGASRFLEPRDFGRYLTSDYYSPATRLQLGFCSNGADFNNNPVRTSPIILVEEITLGTDINLATGTVKVGKGQFRYAVATSLSGLIWFDFLNPLSSPILNVDYRIGFPELYLRHDLKGGFFRNWMIRVALFQHESTHIGDELTLYRQINQFPITRINISYESGEASLTLNDPAGQVNPNHAFVLGAKWLYRNDPSDGYYTMQDWEGDRSRFVPSQRKVEGYLRYQYDGFGGFGRIGKFYPLVSAELRMRIRYGYPYYVVDAETGNGIAEVAGTEGYAPGLNLYAGWRKRDNPGQSASPGIYLRYYTGSNPHGQFRNIPRYDFIGIAVVYD